MGQRWKGKKKFDITVLFGLVVEQAQARARRPEPEVGFKLSSGSNKLFLGSDPVSMAKSLLLLTLN